MSDRDALARAKATGGECRAAVWFRRTVEDGEWYEWDSCNQEAGHEGPHRIWSERYSDYWFIPWSDGDSGVTDGRGYVEAGTEWRTEPSPWTASELEAWASL